MRIALASLGSTGDVLPFLALGYALGQHGHQVRLCTEPEYAEPAQTLGLDFYPIADPMPYADYLAIQSAGISGQIGKALRLGVTKRMLRQPTCMLRRCRAVVRHCDLVICHAMAVLAQEAAILQDIPWLSVYFTPGLILTRYHGPLHLPNLGSRLNRLTWKGLKWLFHGYNAEVRRVLRAIGGRRVDYCIERDAWGESLNFLAASPTLAPLYPNLPAHIHCTGDWSLHAPDAHLPEAIARFLETGPPPLLVTLGSMAGRSGDVTGALVLQALRLSGYPRAIMQHGRAHLTRDTRGLDICWADHVPHHLLMPRVAGVVHHSGAGTAHAVARVGVPSIPVPHLGDQAYWATCLRAHGAATPFIYRRQLTPRRLARRIREAMSQARLRQGAQHLASAMRQENGLDMAVQLIGALRV